jgi:hypothetical protein
MEEELDEMVLALWAIEAYEGYSPAQRERMTRYVRSLAAYDVTRPSWKRPSTADTSSNVVDLETHAIRRKLEPVVHSTRKSALAHGLAVHQTYACGVNEFGDLEFADID